MQGVDQSVQGLLAVVAALGDPDTSTSRQPWEYVFRTGNEVIDFGHTRVREGMITNASAGANYGSVAEAMLGTGTGCAGGNVVDACRMIVGVDFGQVPLSTTLRAHTADLNLYLPAGGWNGAGGASSMTLTVHQLNQRISVPPDLEQSSRAVGGTDLAGSDYSGMSGVPYGTTG